MDLKRISAFKKWEVGIGVFLYICLLPFSSFADLEPNDVLILVNQNSPTSRYIAKLYRQYYPDVPQNQVLELSGLTDCSGPSATAEDEIISRTDYDNLIAKPVRDFLAASGLVTKIKVIITTAGMPYRIDDSNPAYDNAIYAGGSNPTIVSGNLPFIDAASVESELTCLWYTSAFDPKNRMVNVYQGYRQSSICNFERALPDSKTMLWTEAISMSGNAPKIEGENEWSFPITYGAKNRSFNAGDIYLVSRLDGPKNQGQTAIYAVRAMLERAKRASDPSLGGVNPAQAVVVIDDSPSKDYDNNRIYNLDGSVNYAVFDPDENQPPDAISINLKNDYDKSYTALTNTASQVSILNANTVECAYSCLAIHDKRYNQRTNQTDLNAYASTDPNRDVYQGIIALATYGYNGDEGSSEHYLLESGPERGPLFNCVNGAVFTSIESLNAVTMFSDISTLPAPHHQGKIIDFIEMGGAGAIGHAFEPISEAVIDNLYLHYNLLSDADSDGYADLTFIEAAYTAIPFLSWTEVVIGDPLMKIAYGTGGKVWKSLTGDANNDGQVVYYDLFYIKIHLGGELNSTNPANFEKYDDLCDINKDGIITYYDLYLAKVNLGTIADWR